MKLDDEKVDKCATEVMELIDKKRQNLNLAEEMKLVTHVAITLLTGVSMLKFGGDPDPTEKTLELFSADVMENVERFKKSRKPILYRLF